MAQRANWPKDILTMNGIASSSRHANQHAWRGLFHLPIHPINRALKLNAFQRCNINDEQDKDCQLQPLSVNRG
jgi:hypothetical protein